MSDEEPTFKEKLESLSFPRKAGQSEVKPVVNEYTGKQGGVQVEHWDGSQDAHVFVEPVKGFGKQD